MSRRYVFLTLALAALMGGAFALVWLRSDDRGTADAAVASPGTAPGAAPADDSIAVTSEELIARALAAGDISYEDSLRARAFALFDDPRLEPAFRAPIRTRHSGGTPKASGSSDGSTRVNPRRSSGPRSDRGGPPATSISSPSARTNS